ncbi:MAG: fibrillarin-like rRNA/tRNA 2'-O-methyltransferase [Candidatus Aenigmatarchaeota archaeon]
MRQFTIDWLGQKKEWDPYHSKLAAALACGLKENPIKKGSILLYLGASTGTTVSHVSNIVSRAGFIYAVEFAERVFTSLVKLAEQRKNIMPLLADARKPNEYGFVEKVDVVYVDIAQPDEVRIAILNTDKFLKKDGFLMMAIKSQSIDVVKNPRDVYKESCKELEENGFAVIECVDINRFERCHAFIIARKL